MDTEIACVFKVVYKNRIKNNYWPIAYKKKFQIHSGEKCIILLMAEDREIGLIFLSSFLDSLPMLMSH